MTNVTDTIFRGGKDDGLRELYDLYPWDAWWNLQSFGQRICI